MKVVRYFEDVEVGEMAETPGRTLTERDVMAYAGISGDHEALAAASAPEVPGILVVAIVSGLGFRVPRARLDVLAFLGFDWRFLGQTRVGDTVHCRLTVTAKRAMREAGILVERRELVNQRGEVIQEGECKFLVARRPPA